MTGETSEPLISETCKHSLDQPAESPQRPSKIVKLNDNIAGNDVEEEEQCASNLSEMRMNPNPRLQRYLVAVEYIGTRFAGAQQQSNGRTVVGVLEVVLSFLRKINIFSVFFSWNFVETLVKDEMINSRIYCVVYKD